MKLGTFSFVVTILSLLLSNPQLYGQCHGRGGSPSGHSCNSTTGSDAATAKNKCVRAFHNKVNTALMYSIMKESKRILIKQINN